MVRSRGNVLMLFGFAVVPMVFATGMGIDYSRAARLRTKLNAIADAAALSAVTQSMMEKTDAEAKTTAINMFDAQAHGLPGLFHDDFTLTVTITPTYGATIGRIATVSYKAQSANVFGGVLRKETIAIGGSSTANATKAPYIDFYLLLDTSPSMLLPSTSEGLSLMRQLTTGSAKPSGCAFACHLSQPHTENIYVTDQNAKQPLPSGSYFDSARNVKLTNGTTSTSDDTFADSYWLAQNRSIMLRIDAEQVAVQDLTIVAAQTASDNKVVYRMAVHRFDYGPNFGTVAALTSDLPSVKAKATNLPLTVWYKNGMITSSLNIDDQSTDFKTAFDKMNGLMPDPGSGKTASNPQQIMFMITDGMSDENLNGRTHRELQGNASNPMHGDQEPWDSDRDSVHRVSSTVPGRRQLVTVKREAVSSERRACAPKVRVTGSLL